MEQKKKRIKLITFAPHPNFGTCLQSYALNKVLRDLGHDVVFIYNEREVPVKPLKAKIIGAVKRVIKLFVSQSVLGKYKAKLSTRLQGGFVNKAPVELPAILKLPNHPFYAIIANFWPGFEEWIRPVHRNLQWRKVLRFTFHDGNFNMHRVWTHKQYQELNCETDLYITGSDQIWNPYCGGYNPMMFVEFGGDVRRVAYSSSISQPEIHPSVRERMAKALSKFSHIAVREQLSVNMLNHLLHRTDVRLVVDPTYLLTAEQWDAFGQRAKIEFELPEHYIFCYFVGYRPVFDDMVEEAKRHTGIKDVIALECYNRNHVYGCGCLYKDAGPYEWVYLLEHADYVCMDSFHATVFSLKFKKDFVVAMKNSDNETGSQNGRMYDILARYGLQNKIFKSRKDAGWHEPVDYSKVTPVIEAEIADSMNFLKQEIDGK